MKTVLITGSTSGIGLGIALEFARTKQYHIVLNGLEKEGPDIARNIAQEFGIQTIFNGANLMKKEEVYHLAQNAIDTFGKVDVLINNAGIQHVSHIDEFPDEKWEAILQINLSSAFYLTKALWKPMKSQKFGRIINIASAHGLVASEYKSAYVASKHGIIGLTKVLALEGAPFNITANAICPGYVRTPLVDKQIEDQAKSHNLSPEEVINKVMLYKQAVKEFIPAELIGQTALFLASEKASTITGTAIPIDGGWNAQ